MASPPRSSGAGGPEIPASRHASGFGLRQGALAASALAALLLALLLAYLVFAGPARTESADRSSLRDALVVSTLAGDGAPGWLDGRAERARFADPFGVAVDPAGHVYVADAGDNNRIRKITPGGVVTTLAGGDEGFVDGYGPAAQFHSPSGLALDSWGNLYVADTGNHAIRKVTPAGLVTTLAGDGVPGDRDGPALEARFDGPIGVAVDDQGDVYVADTYNDRVRRITPDGWVTTVAGGGGPGYLDGAASEARFDTPCGLAVAPSGDLFVADTGNDAVRRVARNGSVSTFGHAALTPALVAAVQRPIGIAVASDGAIYVTDRRGLVIQLLPDGEATRLAGSGLGFRNGEARRARFTNPTGVALGRPGSLVVADAGNYLVREVAAPAPRPRVLLAGLFGPPAQAAGEPEFAAADVPRLDAEILGISALPWPLDPQDARHELAGTMGEPRGSAGGDGRERLHAGIDVRGDYGAPVRVVREEKAQGPIGASGFDSLAESISLDLLTYTHLRVGRDHRNRPLDPDRFIAATDDRGRPARARVRRGTRFRVGDVLGTINRANHTHLDFGPRGVERNPLALPFVGFRDYVPPTIARDGIRLFDRSGQRFTQQREGRLLVSGEVSIVVEAYDQVDDNRPSRRLGLFELGYQVLRRDGTPGPGFREPRMTIRFDRLPPDPAAPLLAYAEGSGITVYGSPVTRFLYIVTNAVQPDGAKADTWDASALPPGDYILRIIAADYAGNVAVTGRDLPITIEESAATPRPAFDGARGEP